jgi:histidinol-phosphate phosphatase family protein
VATTDSQRRAVFIDRDGTLIREKNYLSKIKDVALISGAVEALKALQRAGYLFVIVSNQSGIGRGYFTEKKLLQIHRYLRKLLLGKGVTPDGIYYCPHHPDAGCDCRKPRLGMIKQAQKELGIDLAASYTIGDRKGDYLLGRNMGGKGIFVLTGHGKTELKKIRQTQGLPQPDCIARNLPAAARWILKQETKGSNKRATHIVKKKSR